MVLLVDNPELIQLGQRIRSLRTDAGISQTALAELAGLNRVSLNRIEAGLVDVSYSTLVAVAAALGVSVSDLTDLPPAEPERPHPISKRK